MVRIFRQLDKVESEGLENYVIPLAIRLQFEFAARYSEIAMLQWLWVDLENRRVVWPDSKTGGISKPMSDEAYRLLSAAPREEGVPHVLPSPSCPGSHLTEGSTTAAGAVCSKLRARRMWVRMVSAIVRPPTLPIRAFRSRSAWR